MQNQDGQCETPRQSPEIPFCRPSEEKSLEYSVSLAPLDSVDMGMVRAWRNDHKIWKWCRQNDLISDYEQMQWFNAQAKDATIKMYKIVLGGNDKIVHVGVCGFTSIDNVNRRAEFSLYIAPAFQRNNLGSKGLSCLLMHGFKNLGLNLIYGEVFLDNPAMNMFLDMGFYHEGMRRDFYFRDGKFIDAFLISMKASEWTL